MSTLDAHVVGSTLYVSFFKRNPLVRYIISYSFFPHFSFFLPVVFSSFFQHFFIISVTSLSTLPCDGVANQIPLSLNCGIFVTLNPAGESYGGRQALPSNLQALFRPIVMQQPEPKEIARVILFVEGFEHAEAIGACMVELFAMAKKMLSPQRHYEWGLRELKTVLLACGQLLRQEIANVKRNTDSEMQLAINALRINTMSKLTSDDCQRFDMLIGYVFANVTIDNASHDTMRESIEMAFEQLQLRISERQLEKCLQLREQLEKRMGVVVLGPPNCGKSTIIALLKQSLLNAGKSIKQYVISPKAMNRNQLLGHLDPDTRQWNDGTLTSAAIAVNNEQAGKATLEKNCCFPLRIEC